MIIAWCHTKDDGISMPKIPKCSYVGLVPPVKSSALSCPTLIRRRRTCSTCTRVITTSCRFTSPTSSVTGGRIPSWRSASGCLLVEPARLAKERDNKRIATEDIYRFRRASVVRSEHSVDVYQERKMRYYDALFSRRWAASSRAPTLGLQTPHDAAENTSRWRSAGDSARLCRRRSARWRVTMFRSDSSRPEPTWTCCLTAAVPRTNDRGAAIAGLVAADEDTVRDVIHAFNERGLASPGP